MPINSSPLSAHYSIRVIGAGYPNVEYAITDRIDGQIVNPQDATNKPQLVFSNGHPCLRFNQAQNLVFPIKRTNQSTFRWGFACWVKHVANAIEAFLSISVGTSGANLNVIYSTLNTGDTFTFSTYADNINSRDATIASGNSFTNSWKFIRLMFDGGGTAEPIRQKIFVNEVEQTCTFTGTATPQTRLRLATGNVMIGNFSINNASQALRGDTGSDYFFFDDNVTPDLGRYLMSLRDPRTP